MYLCDFVSKFRRDLRSSFLRDSKSIVDGRLLEVAGRFDELTEALVDPSSLEEIVPGEEALDGQTFESFALVESVSCDGPEASSLASSAFVLVLSLLSSVERFRDPALALVPCSGESTSERRKSQRPKTDEQNDGSDSQRSFAKISLLEKLLSATIPLGRR